MVITENILRTIVRMVLSETLDRSYRYNLHNEIPGRIPDWEYDSWDDETDERNRERLSKRLGGRDMSHFTYPNCGKNTSIDSVLKDMGFIRLRYSSFMGGGVGDDVKNLLIEKDKFNAVKKQFQSALNFFNYKVVKMYDYNGNDFGYDIDGVKITIEPVFTNEVGMKGDGIYYHATPDRNVSKILKQGLVPKDRGQLGAKRPERIYLSPNFDSSLVERLEKDNGIEYTVLTVDLNGMDIKLYNDPYYDNEAVYTVSYIPPSRISVMDPQPHKLERERNNNISKWLEELCDGLGLTFIPEYNAIHGNYNGMEIDLRISIVPNYSSYYMAINGNIKRPNKNGKIINRVWRTNGYLSFGGVSFFKYEEIKPLLINKYLKKILTTGSKVGISGLV